MNNAQLESNFNHSTITKRGKKLISTALSIEASGGPGATCFIPSSFIQATLPHTNPVLPDRTAYVRTTGLFEIAILPSSSGIPYGPIPRLLLAWLCSEIIKQRNSGERVIKLGNSRAELMKNLGLPQTKAYINSFTDQSKRLLTCGISIEKTTIDSAIGSRMFITDSNEFFWIPLKDNSGAKNLTGKIEISEKFAMLVWNESVPLDMRIYRALLRSPLAMDIYGWLVYRFHALHKKKQQSVKIPFVGLMHQFEAVNQIV
jgi:hypothetical protein